MKKLKYKLIMMSVSISIMMVIILSFVSIWSLNQSEKRNLQELEQTLREDFDYLVKTQVQSTVSIIENIYKKSQEGSMSIEEAKERAADIVRHLHYGMDGYFWIDTYEGDNVVMLGQKEVEGSNRYEAQDVNGNYLIKEIIGNGQQEGGGYTDYYFPREGQDIPLPKRSYSLAFEPFQWVIGTGNYTDDIDNIIDGKRKELREAFIGQIVTIIIIALVGFIISCFIGILVSRKLSKPIEAVTSYLHTLSTGDFSKKLPDHYFKIKDEIGVLVHSAEAMRHSIREILLQTEEVSEQVAASSQQLTATSQQSAAVSEEIARSTTEIAQGAVEQAKNTAEGSESLQELGEIIDKDSTYLKELTEAAENVVKLIDDGLKVIHNLSMKTTESGQASMEVYERAL